MNPVELTLFSSRLGAVCDEMGGVLRNAAFSPNIRDRLDFSCAVFDAAGDLCAQAAHIPVHLGSMAWAMREVINRFDWQHGDMVVFNDPYMGGTHLPDVTLIAPVFVDEILVGFVANRAHHADIGAESPGSMPISGSLNEEGLVLEPGYLIREGRWVDGVIDQLKSALRKPDESLGDFRAQHSANRVGIERLISLVEAYSINGYSNALLALNHYGEFTARKMLSDIPDGEYDFTDYLDDDGCGTFSLKIRVTINITGDTCHVDFSGTCDQVAGNVNCPLSVTVSGVYYVFRCLMPEQTPACAGIFRPIAITAPGGSLLNANYPAAVAAGNVETSTRVVDVVLGALAKAIPQQIPAASHGSMNNLAMGDSGDSPWDYYETIGGGMGAGPVGGGLSACQTHMTNTLNTPIEVLETHFPLRVEAYAIRRGSGGAGMRAGGDGLIRSFRFLQPAEFTILSERRINPPWGLNQGSVGKSGSNRLNGAEVAGKCHYHVMEGDLLEIMTPGGGGYGKA